MGNLLDNTYKWAKSRVRATVRSSSARLFIHVEDDGPGLDAAHREAVFARGQRLDEHMPGSGLGLTIAQELAEAYGRTVRLASSVMGGLDATAESPVAGRSELSSDPNCVTDCRTCRKLSGGADSSRKILCRVVTLSVAKNRALACMQYSLSLRRWRAGGR